MSYTYQFIKEGELKKADRIILMSKSPRRRDLLRRYNPEIGYAKIDERKIEREYMKAYRDEDFTHRAGLTCCQLAMAKSGSEEKEGALYISSDTMVVFEEKVYNKPKDQAEAKAMLMSYLGKEQTVVTSVCLRSRGYKEVFYSKARISFSPHFKGADEIIDSYVKNKKPMDKAGAYGIQELPAELISYIEGDIYTIIGLPVSQIALRLAGKIPVKTPSI